MTDLSAIREYGSLQSDKEMFNNVSELEKKRFAEKLMSGYGDTIGVFDGEIGKKRKIPTKWRIRDLFVRLFRLDRKKKEELIDRYSEEMFNKK